MKESTFTQNLSKTGTIGNVDGVMQKKTTIKEKQKKRQHTNSARELKSSAQWAKRTLFAPTKRWGGQREDRQQLRPQFRSLNDVEQIGFDSVHGGQWTDQKAVGS